MFFFLYISYKEVQRHRRRGAQGREETHSSSHTTVFIKIHSRNPCTYVESLAELCRIIVSLCIDFLCS